MWDRVMEVLRTKHPNADPSLEASLDTYTGQPPDLVPVNLTEDMVMEIESRKSEDTRGQGGENSLSLQHWLLRFRKASREL